MHIRNALVIAAVLMAVGLSACGGSKKSASVATVAPQTKAPTQPVTSIASPSPATSLERAFIARVNSVCKRAERSIERHGAFPYKSFNPLHPDVKLLPKVGAFLAGTQSVADRLPLELQELGTPRSGQAQWSRIVALAKQDRALADAQIKAAEASNASAFIATVDEIETTNMQLGRVEITSGLSPTSPCSTIV
jgi:hypothetical protein